MNTIKRKTIKEFLEYCATKDNKVELRQWDEDLTLEENLEIGLMILLLRNSLLTWRRNDSV